MPRNNTGTYTLPSGVNPVVTGTLISANWANPTMDDVAQALTDSLDRNGQGGMLAQFKNASGTVSLPGITWADELDSGWFRNAASDIRAAINGVVTTKHIDDSATTAGEQHPFLIWNGSAFFEPLTSDDGTAATFTTLTSTGAVTIISGGLTVTTGGATVSSGGATIVGDSTIAGDLGITGSYTVTYGADWAYGVIDYTGSLLVDGGIDTVVKMGASQYRVTFDDDLGTGISGQTPIVMATAEFKTNFVVCTACVEIVDENTVDIWTFYTGGSPWSSTSCGFSIFAYTGPSW
jgi:hypothetical protein